MKKFNYCVAFVYAFLTAALVAFSSCRSEDDVNSNLPKERRDIPLSRTEEAISDKTKEFSLNLISRMLQQESVQGENLFFSPLGVSAVLNMLANGAGGNTAAEIYNALSPDGCTAEDLNGFYSKLNTWLPDLDNTATVAMAYSLWVSNSFSVKSSYTDYVKSTLNSDVFVKDFYNPQATQDLYSWCREKTNGCIETIKLQLENTQMAAVNALYFKGTWKNKFNVSQTTEEVFFGTSRTAAVKMMYDNDMHSWYATCNGFDLVGLPYGNEAYSMILILPPPKSDMAQAGKQLSEGIFEDLTTSAKWRKIRLKLPNFKVVNEISVKDVLSVMGVKGAFDAESANFSKISDGSLFLKDLAQKAFVQVDENGTEAAAITYTGGEMADLDPEVSFNHPFFFFIREKSTGLILFMGKVEDL